MDEEKKVPMSKNKKAKLRKKKKKQAAKAACSLRINCFHCRANTVANGLGGELERVLCLKCINVLRSPEEYLGPEIFGIIQGYLEHTQVNILLFILDIIFMETLLCSLL